MLALRRLFAFALASMTAASTLSARANTNTAINTIVDSLDSAMRHTGPTILTLMANQRLNPTTMQSQMTTICNAFQRVTTRLAATPVQAYTGF
ncbi:hypothetical protein B0H15DRAFT_952683 [Mycena belliarum]|uniref:Uncharacterized protein n=1 Tax=Mycena belliarum TaxID=1033014 RepID=A0AAD6TWE4_9AGAR|nr:hypothetical protein B0H15DRAFT_952683 [Mycena belliae]